MSRTKCRGQNVMGTWCRGQNIVVKMLWTKCPGQKVVVKMSWSKCRGRNVPVKMSWWYFLNKNLFSRHISGLHAFLWSRDALLSETAYTWHLCSQCLTSARWLAGTNLHCLVNRNNRALVACPESEVGGLGNQTDDPSISRPIILITIGPLSLNKIYSFQEHYHETLHNVDIENTCNISPR